MSATAVRSVDRSSSATSDDRAGAPRRAPSTRQRPEISTRVAAAGQVTLILWGWALAQYPYLIPPDLTIRAAAAPRITLVLVLWALVAGGLVLFPSLIYLLRVFKREPTRS